MTGKIYRQRFSMIGWIGVAAMVSGPIIVSFYISAWTDAPTYKRPSPVWGVIAVSINILGAVMVLIGREYYEAGARHMLKFKQGKEFDYYGRDEN
jgi:hypothetical protein